MQAAKKAVESVKESAANIGASAKSGLEKTKATVQEKTEKMTAHDPIEKDMATQKKEERISQAELEKQEALQHNSAAKQSATAGHTVAGQYTATGTRSPTNYTTGGHGQPMGAQQMSKMPEKHGLGYGLGQSAMAAHMEGQHTTTGPAGAMSPTSYTTGGHGLGYGLGQSAIDGQMESQYTSTGLGPGTETAAYSTTGELMSPMRANQTSSMPGQHEHGLGHGLEELAEEMVGSNPTGRNTGMGRTTAHNTHVGGTAPAPGGGPRFT